MASNYILHWYINTYLFLSKMKFEHINTRNEWLQISKLIVLVHKASTKSCFWTLLPITDIYLISCYMVKLWSFFMIGHFSLWTLLKLQLQVILVGCWSLLSAVDTRGDNILLFDICIYQGCTGHCYCMLAYQQKEHSSK